METWRDISVIIAMLVANGLAIMTYYRWTRRQGPCSREQKMDFDLKPWNCQWDVF